MGKNETTNWSIFSKSELDLLKTMFPDVALQIENKQEIIRNEQKEEDVAVRQVLLNDFNKRKQLLEQRIQKWYRQCVGESNEIRRYDLLTPYYLSMLESRDKFSQQIIYNFGRYPIPLSTKEITEVADRTKTTSFFSVYLKKLVDDEILIRTDNGHYFIKDEHFLNFLVMRYHPQFKRYYFQTEKKDTAVSCFIETLQRN